jgi:predicted  nucleic acid-binding Zn-ribbon protein
LSIRDQIPLIEQLSALDQDIKRIDDQVAKERGGLEGLRTELAETEKRIAKDKQSLGDMEKIRNELHTELRQMTQQIERSREKMGRARNERETVAVTRELEELRKLQRDREDEVQRITTSADGAKDAITQAEAKQKSLGGAIDGGVEGVEKLLSDLATERAGKQAERDAVVKQIPQMLYRRYEQIRSKRPVAIAKTTTGTCQGCFMDLPPMMFQTLRKQDAFDQCPHCKRVLYYVPPEPSPEAAPETPGPKRTKAADPEVA